MGSRYGGLKQIDPVGPGGEAILDYSVFDALRAGFGKVVFVIRQGMADAFKQAVGSRFDKHVPVEFVFQELDKLPPGFTPPPGRQKPWGTAHAVLMAADAISGPFAAINADDFYGANSYRLLADHLRSGSPDYAMIGFILRNTLSEFGSVARGVCQVSPTGYLQGVTELTKIEKDGAAVKYTDASGQVHPLTGDESVSMNIWGFTPGLFHNLQQQMIAFLTKHGQEEKSEFYIPTAVNNLTTAGLARVKMLRTPDSWFGVTYREDRPLVVEGIRRLIAKGDYGRALVEIDKRPLQAPGSNALRAEALALAGRREEATLELDRVLKLSKQRYVAAYDIALIYAALADTESTFLWLERALESRSSLINFLAQDPMLTELHGDPRFASLVQRIGIYHRVLPRTAADLGPA